MYKFNIIQNPIVTDRKHIIGTIYCYTNLNNNKKYIGKTLRNNWHLRINEHTARRSDCYHLHRALTKYGDTAFKIDVLYQTSVMDNTLENKLILNKELSEAEIECIKLFDTTNPKFGYNITKGGDGIVGYKFSKESKQRMSKSRAGSNHWNYGKYNSAGKSIKQYTLDGEFVKEYPSMSQASRETSISVCNIVQCKNKKADSAGGFIWKSSEDPPPTTLECENAKRLSNDKSILQFTLKGEFIQEFISASVAAKSINYNSSAVSGAANGKFKACGPYIFIYKSEFSEDLLKDKITKIQNYKPKSPYKKCINQKKI